MTEATRLLDRLSQGDQSATDQLLPLVYGELYLLASRSMQGQRQDHTLQATALVNEACLRLFGSAEQRFEDRLHFLAIAAKAMRSVLIDHARARLTRKRGGGATIVALAEVGGDAADRNSDAADPITVLALHEALEALAAVDPFLARLVELRYFGGATIEEAAEALEVSPRTVKRGWRTARAWLRRALDEGEGTEHDDREGPGAGSNG